MSKRKKFKDGTLCHIKFGKTPYNGEIYNYHLAILFNIPGINNTVFCIPLTSPKEKHFTSLEDLKNRNYRNMKYYRYHYIKQTDSIALLEQLKTISIDRMNDFYRDADNEIIVLNEKELNLLVSKIEKYVKMILYKK